MDVCSTHIHLNLCFFERWDEYGDNVSKMNGVWIQLREDGTRNTWWWEVESPAAYCVFQDGTKVRSHLGIFKQGILEIIEQLPTISFCVDFLRRLYEGQSQWLDI